MWKKILGKHGRHIPKSTTDQTDGAASEETILVREQLAELVYLIATHDAAARQVIENASKEGTFGDRGLGIKIGFDAAGPGSAGCTCQYDLEYCGFIRDNLVDVDKLRVTCANIRRGVCSHVSENTSHGNRALSFTTMMHVAAGSNNLDIVKLLLKLSKSNNSSISACGLLPIQVSLDTSATEVTEFLITHTDVCKTMSAVGVAKQDKETGKIIYGHVSSSSLFRFIRVHLAEGTSDELVGKLGRVLSKFSSSTFDELILSLLTSSKERLACRFIQASQRKTSCYDWHLVVYCVLMNAKDCLRTLLQRDISVNACLKLTGYNFLDIAHAFESLDCFDILHASARLTDDVYKRTSPYTFLIKFAYRASRALDPSLMVRLITRLHALGHDVNHQDDLGMTPLLHAIAFPVYNPTVIHTLCSIGADIDAKDRNGRTPLYSAVTEYNSPLVDDRTVRCRRGAIKDILLHNPDVSCSINQNAVYYAAVKDIRRFQSLEYLSDEYVIKFKANTLDEHDEDREAQTFEERFIALSSVALLYEFGFKGLNMKSLRHVYTDDEYLPVLSDYLARIESVPRTLQSSCRLAIRKEYPGSRLFTVMQNVNLPKTLKNYIAKPYELNYVDIEGVKIYDKEHTIRIDLHD